MEKYTMNIVQHEKSMVNSLHFHPNQITIQKPLFGRDYFPGYKQFIKRQELEE